MSTDSSQNPKPLSVLVIVEGQAEREFFSQFGEKLGLNLTIHTVCCNVYNLFRWMTEDLGDIENLNQDELDLDIPKLIAEHAKNDAERALLSRHYDLLYLIYDCDLQDTLYLASGRLLEGGRLPNKCEIPPVGDRARANLTELRKMIALLDDEYELSVGKLLINYPMVESLWDADSFYDPLYLTRKVALSTLEKKNEYKREVRRRLLFAAIDSLKEWTRGDYCDLIRMNLDKASIALRRTDVARSEDEMESCLSQGALLTAQIACAKDSQSLYVLNTSVFIPLEYSSFASEVLSSPHIPRIGNREDCLVTTYDYIVSSNSAGAKREDLLATELQGLIRVERNVDVIIFPETFCQNLPDYEGAICKYDMVQPWARDAVQNKLKKSSNWHWCCRATMISDNACSLDDLIKRANRLIVVILPHLPIT